MCNIGSRIRLLRKEENLTQAEFSRRLFISQSYLSGLENGNEKPTDKLIRLISLEFGVDEKWLLSGDGEMYGDIFEHNKTRSVDISNEALLLIMNLLNTKSNIEYSHCAHSLLCFARILKNKDLFDNEKKAAYLSMIEIFSAEFQRAVEVLKEKKEPSWKASYKKALNSYIDDIFILSLNEEGLESIGDKYI